MFSKSDPRLVLIQEYAPHMLGTYQDIKNPTQANAIVYEPFSGSFSTGIACEQLGRICYDMELDEKFASASIRRYAKDYGAENITVEREGKVYKYSEIVNEVSDDGDD